ALAVLDRPERRLQRAATLVDEEHHGRRVVLEEALHRRPRRRDVHRGRRVGHDAGHAPVHVTGRLGRRHAEHVVDPAQRPQRRLPRRRPGVQVTVLRGQPVGRGVQVIGVTHLAGESPPAVLLLVEVTEQRARVRGARNDADLGKAPKYSYFSTTASSWARFYAYRASKRSAPGRQAPDVRRSGMVRIHPCGASARKADPYRMPADRVMATSRRPDAPAGGSTGSTGATE